MGSPRPCPALAICYGKCRIQHLVTFTAKVYHSKKDTAESAEGTVQRAEASVPRGAPGGVSQDGLGSPRNKQ